MYGTVPTPSAPQSPAQRFAAFDVVVIAASLGGVNALKCVLGGLPTNFPAAILIAQHLNPYGRPVHGWLAPFCKLAVVTGTAGDAVRPETVVLAPPDRHMLIGPDHRLVIERSPRVKFCRPSAEPLFVSAASSYRERALGVVLTGCNSDGALGTYVLKCLGGRVLVQDPASAQAGGMPRAAIGTGHVDFVVPLEQIAAALVALVMVPGAAELFRVYPAA